MRRTTSAVVCACAALAVAGCSRTHDQPLVNVPTTPPAATQPIVPPGNGEDAIGGSVTNDLPHEPLVRVPSGKAPTRLLTKDLVLGSGTPAGTESTVTVRYVGLNLSTGRPFHSTWDTGGTETFSLVGYVVGFSEGVAGMRPGGRREIVVPPTLAYGRHGYGNVGPNETLVFVVDLITVT
jgi:peptidylprolyl isomerase